MGSTSCLSAGGDGQPEAGLHRVTWKDHVMDEAAAGVAVFRACASALLGMNLSSDEARAAAAALRQGDIGLRLAMLLDGLVPTQLQKSAGNDPVAEKAKIITPKKSVKNVSASGNVDKSSDALFDDVKRRKITKGQLFSLFRQVNSYVANRIEMDLSMREALAEFKREASLEDWDFLVDVIRGAVSSDPFLAGITGR